MPTPGEPSVPGTTDASDTVDTDRVDVGWVDVGIAGFARAEPLPGLHCGIARYRSYRRSPLLPLVVEVLADANAEAEFDRRLDAAQRSDLIDADSSEEAKLVIAETGQTSTGQRYVAYRSQTTAVVAPIPPALLDDVADRTDNLQSRQLPMQWVAGAVLALLGLGAVFAILGRGDGAKDLTSVEDQQALDANSSDNVESSIESSAESLEQTSTAPSERVAVGPSTRGRVLPVGVPADIEGSTLASLSGNRLAIRSPSVTANVWATNSPVATPVEAAEWELPSRVGNDIFASVGNPDGSLGEAGDDIDYGGRLAVSDELPIHPFDPDRPAINLWDPATSESVRVFLGRGLLEYLLDVPGEGLVAVDAFGAAYLPAGRLDWVNLEIPFPVASAVQVTNFDNPNLVALKARGLARVALIDLDQPSNLVDVIDFGLAEMEPLGPHMFGAVDAGTLRIFDPSDPTGIERRWPEIELPISNEFVWLGQNLVGTMTEMAQPPAQGPTAEVNVWDLTKPDQEPHVIEVNTVVTAMTALSDGRVALATPNRVEIWTLGDPLPGDD